VLLVANKAEGRLATSEVMEAYRLGLGDPVAVSAEHGEGIADLMSEIADRLAPVADVDDHLEQARPLRLAIVGRPNAGKSSLMNRLLGQERMLTGPEPGLTRDAILAELVDDAGRRIELVDTAGLRKRARIEAPLEKLSTSASIEALKMAELVALVVDATEGLHEQDLQIARLVEREGRACMLILNKWDAVLDRSAALRLVADRLETSLAQMKGIPLVTLSALGELNRWFEDVLERHPPPLVEGRRLKLRYITQVKARPPTFVVFGTRAEQLPEAYRRYLVNGLRTSFNLPGTPIRLQARGTKNPFAEA
jgi:GTP-binding protein